MKKLHNAAIVARKNGNYDSCGRGNERISNRNRNADAVDNIVEVQCMV